MEEKGLCSTCEQAETCIFIKNSPVWLCEEFSNGKNVPTRLGQVKVKRVVREEITESE